MKKLLCAVLAILLICCTLLPVSAEALQVREDGRYRILLLADPQDDEDPEPDMAPLIETAIRTTQPDLIVVLGDLVEDDDVRLEINTDGSERELPYDKVLENCRTALRYVFEPIIASGIPYTAVLGNNDYKSGLSADDLYDLLRAQKGILLPETKLHSDGRISNILPIVDTDGTELLRLFLMDTGKNGVSDEQIRWFNKANDRRDVPAIVFQHIPVDEAGYLWQFCFPWEEGAIHRGSFFTLRLNTRIARGNDHGKLWDGNISRQFLSWKWCGNVIGAYFGHVHDVSVEGKYLGTRMGMVYSDRWNGSHQHGAAVLDFDRSDMRSYTWTPYIYTGSVTTGDAAFAEDTYAPYPVYTGFAWLRHQWQGLCSYLRHKD